MFRIKTIHAFIAIDNDDEEGVIGMQTDNGWMSFVCADESRIKSLRPIAEKLAKARNLVVKLVKFSVREDIETIGGN